MNVSPRVPMWITIRAALGISNSDHIYVALTIRSAQRPHRTVDVSVDGGATYKSVPIEARKTPDRMVLGSPAVAGDNTVYAAFFGWRKFNGTVGRATCRCPRRCWSNWSPSIPSVERPIGQIAGPAGG